MKVFIPVIAASALLASTVSGWSGTAIDTLTVKITISPECKVNPDGNATLDFKTPAILNKDADADGTIKVLCTKGTTYSIGLDAGTNPSTQGDVATRRMKSSSADGYVGYQLYSDVDRKNVWGNTEKKDTVASKIADGTAQPYTVYGRALKTATGVAGAYSDQVTVTVTF
ncbi:Csu type fimbrial protein [Phyllobacterium calauticae]|uniref:Csu type fimbrial protein n=1 Tax=Phyllobacterium calauticae TaxID=2817027 RepID=UPI001CBB6C03|nr:spore coat U domain-containing protein [Phyllobacterium calauticae]MBZ3691234.1 spore coat U domain-containing protein [Phyllobacterium calauticae]